MKIKSVTTKILSTTVLVIVILAGLLMLVMNYFMNSLTDTIMLSMLQPMAKIASQSVEGRLHTLVDNFFLIRDNNKVAFCEAGIKEKRAVLEQASSGIEFVWLGIYEIDGSLLVGGDECPRNISGRALYSLIRKTNNVVIEDTSIGASGLEIVMGIPIMDGAYGCGKTDDESRVISYLVGSYKYDVLSDVLLNINIGTHGTAFIINKDGALIAHKDLGKVFSLESIATSLGSSPAARQMLAMMQAGQTGSADIQGFEGQMFVSYSPVRGTLWSLGIQAPRSDFMAAAQSAIYTGTIITIIALIFFAIILSVFMRKILSVPLFAITRNARELALGKFENKFPANIISRNDEIGQLAAAFITMSNSIRGVINDIGQLTLAARAGSLADRVNELAYHGDYHLIISGMNATMNIICSHFDAMPGALMLLNENKQPLYLNRAMREILDKHQLDSTGLLAAIQSADTSHELAAEILSLFSAQRKNGDSLSANIDMKDSYNNSCNYSFSLRRVDDAQDANAASCIMLILNDVTMLTRAKIEAEMASHAKSDFLSRMSHEIRTPMNAIIGMTSIGMDSDDINRKEYCLTKISEASQHLLGVINDILDMSKIEADKFELSFNEFNFEKMLQRVTDVINFRAEEKNQTLLIEIDRNIPVQVISDEQRLAQVITNLLSNAVKFTPDRGTISLKASKLAEDDKNCTIRVVIKDNGIGISAEQQKRLFRSFEQADGGISRKFGGTGLGLAISRRIVEMMHGRIWVESELNKGSSFIFEINALKGAEPVAGLLPTNVDWHHTRILAVDDAPEILELFKTMLAPYGVQCETAISGEQALGIIEQSKGTPFDVIFVDWRMPEMNGIELTREIMKQDGSKPFIVLITAADWSEIEQSARQAGVSRFLPKPLFPSSLVDCINEAITHQKKAKSTGPAKSADNNGVFAGKHIMLAEDVAINREITMMLLRHTAIEIDFAVDGADAVEKITAAPDAYDLILMDVHMPNVDGYEATRRIRSSALPTAANIPIIAMTANVFREDIERCLAAGMNDHLGKPINPAEVIATLKRYLLPNSEAQ